MKKKVLYVTLLSLVEGNGISNKIQSQVDAFHANGCETHLMYYKIINGCYYLYLDNKEFYRLGGSIERHFKKKMFYAIKNYIITNKIDILYYRYNNMATQSVVDFFMSLEGFCTRLLEIPTYPYDKEFESSSISLRIANWIEKYYRLKFKYCIDKIIAFVNDAYIYDVPVIKISNGVDINQIPQRIINRNKEHIRLIAVANINFWHGYDRVIEGMKDYYSKSQSIVVELKIVGDGDSNVKNKLKELVEHYKLNDYVTFYGNTSGDKLDMLFNDSDIAIGCLACHRKNITTVKALKNVEYAVRGIPFIYSECNEDFDDKDYVLKIMPDDSPIDIKQMVSFFNNLTVTPEEIRKSAAHLTWTEQMKTILSEI